MNWKALAKSYILPAIPMVTAWFLKEWPAYAMHIPQKYNWVVPIATGFVTYTGSFILLHMQPPTKPPAPPPVQ